MNRVAAIDCGTNSIRLLVADVDDQHVVDVVREMRIVRLGEGVDETGLLASSAIERTIAACREYRGIIAAHDVENTVFAATSATRDAANAAEFTDAVSAVLGVQPRVFSGDQEARASFRGATSDVGEGTTLVIDIGGGSTEFVQGLDEPSFAQSVNMGCVRMTERFLRSDPPTLQEINECTQFIDELINPVLTALPPCDTLVMVAGTSTSIAAHILGLDHYDSERIHASRFSFDQVQVATEDLLTRTVAQRRELGFMHPGRADVIGGGSLVVQRILHYVNCPSRELVVSERDILDGLALTAAEELIR